MSKFCTNCGKENNKKVCPHCGVKRNTTHLFCEWCGEQLTENASICIACKEKVKPDALKKVFSIISIIFIAFFIFAIAMSISSKAFISVILFVLGIFLLLPFTKNAIKSATHTKQSVRKPLNIIRIVLVIVLAFVGVVSQPASEFEIYTVDATKAAEVVFHEEVALKNESSFVINDSNVTYLTEPYNGKEALRLVTVEIDYSAQNGFGGNNRDDYTIKILFNVENGNYYRLDGTIINK